MTPGLVGAFVARVAERVPALEGRVWGFEAPAAGEGDPAPALPYAVVSYVSGVFERRSRLARQGSESVQVSVFAATAAAAAELADLADRELSGGPLALAGEPAGVWVAHVSSVAVPDPGRSREGERIYHVAATYRATTERPAPAPRA